MGPVGRERELEAIVSLLEGEDGSAHIVLLEGEMGIGKRRASRSTTHTAT